MREASRKKCRGGGAAEWQSDGHTGRRPQIFLLQLLLCALCASVVNSSPAPVFAQEVSWFATRVLDYSPAPGQFVRHPAFNDPSRALGPPVGGGTLDGDDTKVVTLGGFGGSITLGFDRRVVDDPKNPMGIDFIVFGNAFWVGGDPNRRWAEAATVEISLDANGNGIPDDPWFVMPGSHLALPPAVHLDWQTWDDDVADPTWPPHQASWLPFGASGTWTTWAYRPPPAVFEVSPVLDNPNGPWATVEGVWGYADLSPTLVLGDLTGNNAIDDPTITPDRFYTVPDDPFEVGVSVGSGGGDAFDIAWAVDPATGLPAMLPGFDFIRITTACNVVRTPFGESSAEIGGVAIVRSLKPGPGGGAAGPQSARPWP